jgi:hypothetical protein
MRPDKNSGLVERKKWHIDRIFPLNFWPRKKIQWTIKFLTSNMIRIATVRTNLMRMSHSHLSIGTFSKVPSFDCRIKHSDRHIFELQVWACTFSSSIMIPGTCRRDSVAVPELTFVYAFGGIWSTLLPEQYRHMFWIGISVITAVL